MRINSPEMQLVLSPCDPNRSYGVGGSFWHRWVRRRLTGMRLLWLLLPLAGSCATTPSTDWMAEPAGAPVTWRQFRLYRGEDAMVLASQESAASEVHALVARARAALAATGDAPLELGLVIALSEKDAPFFDKAEDYERALRRWGAESNMSVESGPQHAGSGKQPDIDARLLYQMAPVAVPIDDADLNLPVALRKQFTHVLLTPTDALIESVFAKMVEAAFDANDVSWVERKLMYAIADPEAMMVGKSTPGIRSLFVHAWAETTGLSKAQVNVVRAEFGLRERASDTYRPRPGLVNPESAREQLMSLEGLVIDADLQLGVSSSPCSTSLFWMRSMNWSLVVDLNPLRASNAYVLKGAPHYEWLPSPLNLPSRSDAEEFEALRLKHPGFALVFDEDPSRAAALLAAHSFWVRGLDSDAAVAVGLRFGLDPRQTEAVRKRLVR